MYNTSKSLSFSFLVIGLVVFVLTIFVPPVSAVDLPFDPNDYTFLIYNPGGDEASIIDAMEEILDRDLVPSEIRTAAPGNHVTPTDLATYDILIVGAAFSNSNTSGLHADDLLAGITGRVIITGHDADCHFYDPNANYYTPHAKTFLIQAIDYILKGGGTGLIVLGERRDVEQVMDYLPSEWGVTVDGLYLTTGEEVSVFTSEALDSGVYDGLDPNSMSDWDGTYHDIFTMTSESLFVPFENGIIGTLATTVTIARNSTYGLSLTKSDDLVDPNACVAPLDEVVYTLSWSRAANANGEPNEIELIDYLPEGVTFDVEIGTSDGIPDDFTHTIRWDLGTIAAGSSGSRSFRVIVNEQAVPKGTLINRAYLTNYEGKLAYAKKETPVCCWGGAIIHVDKNAIVDYETGVDWAHAYTKLEDALARANGTDEISGCGREIWVAQGVYTTGSNPNDTFKVVAGVEAYGGFIGDENSREQRDPLAYKAYLTSNSNNIVVTIDGAEDPNDTVLDGFVVSGGSARISCNDGDEQTTISHCIIVGGGTGTGISVSNSDLNILDCLIKENGNGINLSAGGEPFIDRCMIYGNEAYGVYVNASIPTILNSCIHHNGMDGLYLDNAGAAIIRNDTIVYNGGFGASRVNGSNPGVANCILWGNNNKGIQYYGCSPTYSCIYDPNDPNNNSTTPNPTTHNLKCDPNFAYPTPAASYNYHLAYDSPCKNKGNTGLVNPGELDMDGFDRIYESNVDMGADEVDCEEISHPADFNADGFINMGDIPKLAAAWLSVDPDYYEPNDYDPNYHSSGWNPDCDIAGVNCAVDIEDLVVLADVWLEWEACWRGAEGMMGMMMMAPGGGETMSFSAASLSAAASSAKTAPAAESFPLATLEEMAAWLEEIYGDNEEFQQEYSPQQWQEFIDEVAASWPDPY